ncbi:hypothetical protein INT48_003050 [Thamnidium elegans]|uniref:Chromo domain-containing protein n=2 Tax=Thamnidium elegans TaxID=101142 RepID=A0A8H7SHV5_9FUNG|nr:hypothetical protein INT48_003050 [Thamnidium elegans]
MVTESSHMCIEQFRDAVWPVSNMRSNLPSVFITDNDTALRNALEEVSPEISHLLCYWHLGGNLESNFRPLYRAGSKAEMGLMDNSIYDNLDNLEDYEVFRIDNMKRKQNNLLNTLLNMNSMSIDDETITTATQNNSYEIEKILNHRKYKKRTKYFVKWKDYDESENCWIWESEFDDDQIIKDYYENLEKL